MRPTHWIRMFLVVFVCALGIIAGAQLLKGHDAAYALQQGALWGIVTAAVFTASAFYRWRRNIACALCDDITGVQAAREARAVRERVAGPAEPR